MASVDVGNIRNVVLLSHSGAGKTSLSEAMIFNAKHVTRLGRIEDGNTVSDFEPEEVKRSSSVQTALIACEADGYKVNFLDTPGYADFVGETLSALRVSDFVVLTVHGAHGIELGTEQIWGRTSMQQVASLTRRWRPRTWPSIRRSRTRKSSLEGE